MKQSKTDILNKLIKELIKENKRLTEYILLQKKK
jgi:hypothetical protein